MNFDELLDGFVNKVNSGGYELSTKEGLLLAEFVVYLKAIQQSVQSDLENESDKEVDPVTQALRNLNDAIAPPNGASVNAE